MNQQNIETQNESLEDAAIASANLMKNSREFIVAKVNFFKGANWQKERDKETISKLLDALKNIVSMNGVGYKDAEMFVQHLQPLIEESKQLIEQIENNKDC